MPTEVITPNELILSGAPPASDDPHADNRAALSPCPVCGVSAHEGPEGEHWVQFPHCWSCGYNHLNPLPNNAVPQVQALPPMAIRQIAAAVAEQIRAEMAAGQTALVVMPSDATQQTY